MKLLLILMLGLLYPSLNISQNIKLEVECGEKIESSFTKTSEIQDFYIDLEAGDNLKIYSSTKYGESAPFLKPNAT